MVWAPRGGVATEQWWPPSALAASHGSPTLGETVQFGDEVMLAHRHRTIEATWRDGNWQSAQSITVTVTPHQVQITVPAVWRAHAYLAWRDGCLLVSSDLRTLAASMPAAQPAPEGVAAFLAGGEAAPGIRPSLYRGIWDVQPGHALTVRADAEMRCHRVWTPEEHEEFATQSLEVVTLRLRNRLDELAERILRSHNRVACLFSGGLDSSLVAATLLRRAPQRVVLFNVGNALGTAAEAALRAHFLQDFDSVTHPVDLPSYGGLVRSLRATNAVAALPTGSPFAHVFEEIIEAAQEHGCDAIITGDGGDEVFAEHEEVLVDLLASRSAALPAATGYFALRNGERGTQTLYRAMRTLRALNQGALPTYRRVPEDILLSDALAPLVATARTAAGAQAGGLWAAGWTCSGLGSYRRAVAVPESQPVSADAPHFPVISPLADAAVVGDALALRPDALVPRVWGGQPKWLLRQAALHWLSPEVALHPKIGSADQQILAGMRSAEHRDLLDLLGSATARSAGLFLPAMAENPELPLWFGDKWIRAAALVAWFDQIAPKPCRRPATVLASRGRAPTLPEVPVVRQPHRAKCAPGRVAALVALNLAAQFAPLVYTESIRPVSSSARCSAPDNELACTLMDLARRACAIPFVSGSSRAMSQALAWYLRLSGKHPVLVRGTRQGRHDTLYWIEVDGTIVDVSGAETPLVPDPE
jgi:asparagine synthetase B (glutamine-hydrolysing)